MSVIKRTDEETLKKYDKLMVKIQMTVAAIIGIIAFVLFVLGYFIGHIYVTLGLVILAMGVCAIGICEVIDAAISNERSSRKRERTRTQLSSNKVSQISLKEFSGAPRDEAVKSEILKKVLNNSRIEAEYNQDNSITIRFKFTDDSLTITVEEEKIIDHIEIV